MHTRVRNVLVFHNKSCHVYTSACIQYACVCVHRYVFYNQRKKEMKGKNTIYMHVVPNNLLQGVERKIFYKS